MHSMKQTIAKPPREGGTHILRHTGMCHSKWVTFSQEIPKHGFHFFTKISINMGLFFQNLKNGRIFEKNPPKRVSFSVKMALEMKVSTGFKARVEHPNQTKSEYPRAKPCLSKINKVWQVQFIAIKQK